MPQYAGSRLEGSPMSIFDDCVWEDLISVDVDWFDKYFSAPRPVGELKVRLRILPLKFSGTKQETLALVEKLADNIKNYIFDKKQLELYEREKVDPFRKALAFFGETNPIKDGKYGELILYMLVETLLKVPMVSHKLQLLTNVNDQVKGGDGIFFGSYRQQLSILIGESKIYQSLASATDSALDSLDRFHGAYSGATLCHELFIARSNISQNFSADQFSSLLDHLNPSTDEYRSCIMVHPVLIVFDAKKIEEIEVEALSRSHAEQLLDDWLKESGAEEFRAIEEKLEKYPELRKVYLEFLFIPLVNVGNFKRSLYKAIHGVEYIDRSTEEADKKQGRKGKAK